MQNIQQFLDEQKTLLRNAIGSKLEFLSGRIIAQINKEIHDAFERIENEFPQPDSVAIPKVLFHKGQYLQYDSPLRYPNIHNESIVCVTKEVMEGDGNFSGIVIKSNVHKVGYFSNDWAVRLFNKL